MCLTVREVDTAKMLKRLQRGPVRAWKVLKFARDAAGPTGPYFPFTFRAGRNKPKGRRRRSAPRTGEINGGAFHLYLSRKVAESECYGLRAVVPVQITRRTFVAAGDFGGDRSACVRSLTLTRADIEKARRAAIKRAAADGY